MIPEDIFFTNEFTEVAKLEDSHETSAGLVSKVFNQVVFSPQSINVGFDSYAGASCYILGQHSFGGPAASLHMLSIPWQVFVMCFL